MVSRHGAFLVANLLSLFIFSTLAKGDVVAFRAGDFVTYTVGYERPATGDYFRWYKDFEVPVGATWDVSKLGNISVFEGGLGAGRTARYEIRSGITAGNGGTLIATGDSAIHSSVFISSNPNGDAYDYQISLPQPVTLGPGIYWVTVQPYFDGTHGSFQGLTTGANAIGGPAFDGFLFESESVNGVVQSFQALQFGFEAATTIYTVPEPSSFALLAITCTIGWYRHRRRRT